jgi:dTDP-4-dehydrorhamnose reductase
MKTDQPKFLILGGSGYVGRNLFAKLGLEKAVATYNNTPLPHGVYFDSLTTKLVDILVNPVMFSHAIILLGDTKPDSCAADIEKSSALNVDSIKSILEDLKRWGIKPVFTSTEVVFDGIKGDYTEIDEVSPILTYGSQKVEIERYLQQHFGEYLIARPALIYGSQSGDGTILTTWMRSIEKRETSKCAHDFISSPIHIEDVVEGLIRLMDVGANGVFHLSGHKPYSRLEIYQTLLDQVNEYSPVDLEPISCSIHDFNLREARPLNVSMKPDKLVKATGVAVRDLEEVSRIVVRDSFKAQPSD